MSWIGLRRMRHVALSLVPWLALALLPCARAAAPANDHFTNAAPFFGAANFTASNDGATAEPGEPAHAGEPAARSLWWRWTAPFTGSFTIVTSNSVTANHSPLDTTVAVYTGASVSKLFRVVANDDTDYGEFGALWSRVVFRAYAGESLMIAVDTVEGATGTIQMWIGPVGSPVPPWQVTGLGGEIISSTSFSGKVLLVDFWETTCGACVEELPDLIRVQSGLEPRGFTIIGLSGDPNPQIVTSYLQGSGVTYPIAMLGTNVESAFGGLLGFPTKYVVDREGKLVGTYLGGHTEAYYLSLLEPLLRAGPTVQVKVARTAGGVQLSWPASEPGYSVETKASLPATTWSPLGVTASVSNNEYVVTIPATGAARFFRLKKP